MFSSIILGIVQGLTEFLPISSSGHLYLVDSLISSCGKVSFDLAFFVFLHLATLCAVCVFFRKDIGRFIRQKNMFLYLCVITAITGSIGIGIDRVLISYFGSKYFLAFAFFTTALCLLATKNLSGTRVVAESTYKDAIILGVVQGLAVIPGLSRSGVTIAVLLRRGYKPRDAFVFSFISVIPALFGAFLWEAGNLFSANFPSSFLIAGFISAVIAGIFALKVLNRFVQLKLLYVFGYYCIVAGSAALLL